MTARETLRQESRGQSTRGGRLLTYLRGSHTPLYSSPQQRQGTDADPRDDVHALGVIGYQMLTGHLAQGAGPDFADDLRDAGAGEEMIALLGRCVAQKAERRPKDAREMVSLLSGLMLAKKSPRGEIEKATAPPLPSIGPKAALVESVNDSSKGDARGDAVNDAKAAFREGVYDSPHGDTRAVERARTTSD